MSRRWQLLIPVPLLALAVALIIWRGPNWNNVHDAFSAVTWEWVFAAIGLNLLSVLARAPARLDELADLAEPERHHVDVDVLVVARVHAVGLVPDAHVAVGADELIEARATPAGAPRRAAWRIPGAAPSSASTAP